MIAYEKLKENIKAGSFSNLAAAFLSELLRKREAELRQMGDAELAGKVKTFADGFAAFDVYSSNADQISEELDRNYREGYGKLAGFKEFLESGKPGEKTNYEKIIAGMDENAHEMMLSMLTKANEDLAFGIDVEALPAREEVAEENENDEPEHDLIEDDLAQPEGRVRASAYIENIRNNGFSVKDPARLSDEQKDLYLDHFLRIMAARELADSKRGDKSKLVSHELSAQEVDARAAEMKKNSVFQRFLKDLKDDPKKMKAAISAAAKSPGHGGGLDDMFKDYVKNLPSLYMDNATVLKRYMPTVKERLEILQKQAKRRDSDVKELDSTTRELQRLQSEGGSEKKIRELTKKKEKLDLRIEDHAKPYIAAEMIALRDISKADKGHKESLDKAIPVSDSKAGSIHYWVSPMGDCPVLSDPAVTSLIEIGHGGEMMAKARELANADPSIAEGSEAEAFFNTNTIRYRMSRLEDEAGQVRDQLCAAMLRGADKEELMKKGKALLAECLLLDGKVRSKETGEIDEVKMAADVPWLEIEKMKKKGPDSNKSFKALLGDVTPEELLEHLDKLDQSGHEVFISSLANKSQLVTASAGDEVRIKLMTGKAENAPDSISEFDEGGAYDNDELNTGVDYGKSNKDKTLGGFQI